MSRRLGAALSVFVMLAAGSAMADSVADFYNGKQIRFVIRTTPGGGGMTAANYMAQIAPRDGTVIGIVSQGLAADQAMAMSPQLKADLREFNWIANVVYSNQLLVVWHTSPTKTIEDAKRRVTTIGTTGAGSASVQYPAFYNNVIGTKFKIVFGYPGGQHIDLAMERGEVEGRGTNPYSGWMASKPTWIPQKLIIPLIQAGLEKEPALPDVPLITEQQVKPEDKPLLQFMAQASTVGRPLATTPGVPAERVAALRAAFFATVKDPEFVAAAAHENLEIKPQTGDKLQEIIFGLLNAPADVRERMKVALTPKDEHTVDKPPGK